jgi:hypothetical protein
MPNALTLTWRWNRPLEHLNLTVQRGKHIRPIQFIQWSQQVFNRASQQLLPGFSEPDLVCGIRKSTSQISLPIAQHNFHSLGGGQQGVVAGICSSLTIQLILFRPELSTSSPRARVNSWI